jgi:hypothetical protein
MPWFGLQAIGMSYLAQGQYGPKLEQFSPEWERAYRGVVSWTKENEKKRGWPEVIIYIEDELSNYGATGAEKGRRNVQIAKTIPGIRTIASMNGQWERVILPGLTIAMPNHAYPITTESVEEIRKAGCDLWFYNIGEDRVLWGFYPWRMNAHGRFQWCHRTEMGEPWNAFDGDSAYRMTRLTPGKPLPTPTLVQIQEGIDDWRYLAALDKAMADARASKKPAAVQAVAAAQKDLDDIRAGIPVDVRLIIGVVDAKEAGMPAVGNLANNRYLDRCRWIVAGHILAIQSAMEK